MKKRIMAILLAQALVISSVAPAYAADTSSGILADEILAGSAEADEFADESAAKAALDDFKKEVEEMSKSVYVNGKYVVAEMKDEIFKGSTIDDVQESEEYEVVEDYDE